MLNECSVNEQKLKTRKKKNEKKKCVVQKRKLPNCLKGWQFYEDVTHIYSDTWGAPCARLLAAWYITWNKSCGISAPKVRG